MKRYTLISVIFLVFAFRSVSQPGTLDPTFGSNGKVLTDFAGNQDYGWSFVLLPDGSVVAAGTVTLANLDFGLTKYSSDGSLDVTFGNSGKVSLDFDSKDDWATKVLLQPDQKLILCGHTSNGTDDDFAMARFNSDGSPDLTFGEGGKVVQPVGPEYDHVNGATLQPDGKIVLVGVSGQYYPSQDVAIARFNSDGSLDNTFANGGKLILNLGQWSEEARDIAVLSDGKLLISGYTNVDAINYNFLVLRLNSDGSYDNSFGTNGIKITNGGMTACGGYGLTVLPDGRFYVAGVYDFSNSYDFVVARYLADGTPDPLFGNGGFVITGYNTYDMAKSVVVQSDNKVIIAGYSGFWPQADFALVRYHENGTKDESFGNAGVVFTDFGALYDMALELKIQPDGKIIAAGYANNGSNYDFALARYIGGSASGLNSAQENVTLDIGPNPVKEFLTLTAEKKITNVAVYSVTGDLVTQNAYQSPQIKIDFSSYPTGAYMVVIKTIDGVARRVVMK